MDDRIAGGAPQFATAEYGGDAQTPCNACGKSTAGTYYQVSGMRVCPSCTQQIAARFPRDSHSAFLRGVTSPFLDFADPVHGLLGLVILFVGIRIAWRLTSGKPATVVGPLSDGAASN